MSRLRCVACAGVVTVPPAPPRCPSCGDGLLLRADDPPTAPVPEADAIGVWRYPDALPAIPRPSRITLGEGGTPLIPMDLPAGPIWVKNEGVNPTGSYKDRFNAVNVSVAAALGARGVTLASTGNAGLSAATYGARARLDVRVYCPPETPDGIAEAIIATGARLVRCSGAECGARVADDVAAGFFPGSRAVPAVNASSFGAEAYRTIAYEVAAQLGRTPDLVYVPVGGGDGLYGIHAGFRDLVTAGYADRTPRMIGVRSTAPRALSIARDEVGRHAIAAVDDSGGAFRSVTADQIEAAESALSRNGVSAEPASATAVAGLLADPETTVVCVVTGSGLKWAGWNPAAS